MRLVGATRWFIRWPFMIEGVIVGFAGRPRGHTILWLGKITIVDPLTRQLRAGRRTSDTIAFPPLVAILFACRGAGLGARLAASPCAASSRSEPREQRSGSRPRRPCLLVALLAPGSGSAGTRRTLPEPLGDVFVDGTDGAHRRGARSDRGQLLPPGRPDASSTNASLQGWSRSCAAATTTASPTTSRREPASASTRRLGALLRHRPQRASRSSRACGSASVFDDTPAADGRDRGRRRHRLRRRATRSPASRRRGRDGEDQGPGGDRGDDRRPRPGDGKTPQAAASSGREVQLPVAQRQDASSAGGDKLGYVQLLDLQRRRPRRAARRGREASSAEAPRGSCSTCAATAAACSTRRC